MGRSHLLILLGMGKCTHCFSVWTLASLMFSCYYIKIMQYLKNDFVHMIEISHCFTLILTYFSPRNASRIAVALMMNSSNCKQRLLKTASLFTWTCVEYHSQKQSTAFLLLNFIYYFSNYHFNLQITYFFLLTFSAYFVILLAK